MISNIRAVYEAGHLRLLDKVDLKEGEQIEVTILTERERTLRALAPILVNPPEAPDDPRDDETLMREIQEGTKGVTLSDAIIEERREGLF